MKYLALFLLLLVGCSSTAMLNKIQTSTTYPNKLPLKAAVYIPLELANRELLATPSTMTCSAWQAKIDAGDGYFTSIISGLSSAIKVVDVIKFVPTPEFARKEGYDLLITVGLGNENLSITVNQGLWTNTINTQFQISFTLSFVDNQGNSLYSYTANGSGFNNISGGCSDIAQSAKVSMEVALKQVADYIAQSTFSGLKEYSTGGGSKTFR